MGIFSPEDLPRLRQQIALRIEFLLASHSAVHAKINAVHRRGRANGRRNSVGDALPRRPAERAARGNEERAVGRDQLHVFALIKHTQCAADFIPHRAMVAQNFLAPPHREIVVAAEVRIERRDLLFALGDENLLHGVVDRGFRHVSSKKPARTISSGNVGEAGCHASAPGRTRSMAQSPRRGKSR